MNNKLLYEEIMTNISKQVKKLIRENEYWDEPFRDDEDYESSGKITKDELPMLSNSEIDEFNFVFNNLVQIANESNADSLDECVRIVDEEVNDVLINAFGKIPSPEKVLSYLADSRGRGIDWSSLEDLGYTDSDGIEDVYYELAHRAAVNTYKY